jgi:hypothetical protein
MSHPALVAVHIAAVLAATVAAPVALRAALPIGPGRARHRAAGYSYVAAWVGIVVTGAVLGVQRPGVSVFEVLNVLGGASVGAAVSLPAVPVLRRRLGREWLRWHIRLMLASTAFLVVASINQGLSRLPGGYPSWLFYVLVALPAFVLPPIGRRLAARAGLPDRAPLGRRGRPAPALAPPPR